VTLAALAARIRGGELSPREAVAAALRRVEERDAAVNAFISVRAEAALAEAAALERAAERGPLWGVPVAVKDVIDVAGERTTAASRILADNVAAQDATTVARLRAAGAVVIGKLNTHEFAFGAMTTSPHFGPAHNPWDASRICGGSSGGSGAAVAAGMTPGTLGTDTAGSIRIPAAFCGVTGVRPSTGRVSNRGVVPVSYTFDTVGPLARTAEDCALLLQTIAGHDPGDPATVDAPVADYGAQLQGGVLGLRIGVVEGLFDRSDPAVASSARSALDVLAACGATLVPAAVPLHEEAGTITQLIMLPEAAEAHLGWLRHRLDEYGPDVRVRLLAGLLLPGTAAVTGQRARRWFWEGLRQVLAGVDVLAAPTMPVTPPPIGAEEVAVSGETILYRRALIPFNSPWALAGLPVVSTPCGQVDGLPVGLAIVGRRLDEGTALRVAHTLQRETDWHLRTPFEEA
jgi:Asp-tRNA(Asn)/Glu-tRNA(Gln) amidotransferase A subunit family amidase